MSQARDHHPDAAAVHAHHEIQKDGSVKYEILVITDLVLDILAPGHDKPRVDALIEWAHQRYSSLPGVDKVTVTQRQKF